MGQFTPEHLARVLANVEREVLVEAIELAGMEQLFLTRTIETIDQLQFVFNAANNLAVFGPAWLKQEAAKSLTAFRAEHPVLAFIFDVWAEFSRNIAKVQDTTGTIFDLTNRVVQLLEDVDLDVDRALIATEARGSLRAVEDIVFNAEGLDGVNWQNRRRLILDSTVTLERRLGVILEEAS